MGSYLKNTIKNDVLIMSKWYVHYVKSRDQPLFSHLNFCYSFIESINLLKAGQSKAVKL